MALVEDEKNIIDIDLQPIQKKKIRLNGDNNQIIELNLSDMQLGDRMTVELETLRKLATSFSKQEEVTAEDVQRVDKEMRDSLDRMFDSHIADICVPSGTLLDPIDGKLRYEYIIDKLLNLYTDNIRTEAQKIKQRVKKYTADKKKVVSKA